MHTNEFIKATISERIEVYHLIKRMKDRWEEVHYGVPTVVLAKLLADLGRDAKQLLKLLRELPAVDPASCPKDPDDVLDAIDAVPRTRVEGSAWVVDNRPRARVERPEGASVVTVTEDDGEA